MPVNVIWAGCDYMHPHWIPQMLQRLWKPQTGPSLRDYPQREASPSVLWQAH